MQAELCKLELQASKDAGMVSGDSADETDCGEVGGDEVGGDVVGGDEVGGDIRIVDSSSC